MLILVVFTVTTLKSTADVCDEGTRHHVQ